MADERPRKRRPTPGPSGLPARRETTPAPQPSVRELLTRKRPRRRTSWGIKLARLGWRCLPHREPFDPGEVDAVCRRLFPEYEETERGNMLKIMRENGNNPVLFEGGDATFHIGRLRESGAIYLRPLGEALESGLAAQALITRAEGLEADVARWLQGLQAENWDPNHLWRVDKLGNYHFDMFRNLLSQARLTLGHIAALAEGPEGAGPALERWETELEEVEGLSPHLYSMLTGANITTLEALARTLDVELLGLADFDEPCLSEVRAILGRGGIELIEIRGIRRARRRQARQDGDSAAGNDDPG